MFNRPKKLESNVNNIFSDKVSIYRQSFQDFWGHLWKDPVLCTRLSDVINLALIVLNSFYYEIIIRPTKVTSTQKRALFWSKTSVQKLSLLFWFIFRFIVKAQEVHKKYNEFCTVIYASLPVHFLLILLLFSAKSKQRT